MKLAKTMSAAAVALLLAGPAFAAEDGPMATAGASGAPPAEAAQPAPRTGAPAPRPAHTITPHTMTTAEQIDAFIRSSPETAAPSPEDMAMMDAEDRDRRVHGSFEVGVGTHGYRHAGVTAHYPIGKSGQVSIALSQTEGRGLLSACRGGALGGPFGGGPLGGNGAAFPGPSGCYAPW